MKKLLFIVNPRAGKTKSRAPLFDAVAQFSRAGYLVRVYITEAGGQARDITARWGGQYDMVVCAGGDGTLNETLSGLMQLEQRPLLGYLPCSPYFTAWYEEEDEQLNGDYDFLRRIIRVE